MKLIKLASITKKLLIGALAAFLLIFLPFHMGMNLCIIRDDGGEWYRNVCHFMGTNWIVKCFEVILLLCVLLHIVVAILVTLENRAARPIGYAVSQKTKTHTGSKYMIWTGIVVLCFLILHFINFYFAKMNLVPGKYVAKVEKVDKAFQAKAMKLQTGNMDQKDAEALQQQYMAIQTMPQDKRTADYKFFVNLSKEDVQKYCGPEFKDYEPDFYNMAKDLFKNPLYVLIYLLVFVVLAIHLYHGVVSVFQTYGLNVPKYAEAIEILAICYAIIIPLGFAVVPLHVILLA